MPGRSNRAISPAFSDRSAVAGRNVSVLPSHINGYILTPAVSIFRGRLPERHSSMHCSLSSRPEFMSFLSGMRSQLAFGSALRMSAGSNAGPGRAAHPSQRAALMHVKTIGYCPIPACPVPDRISAKIRLLNLNHSLAVANADPVCAGGGAGRHKDLGLYKSFFDIDFGLNHLHEWRCIDSFQGIKTLAA